jgi:hypothetical protein
VQVDAMTGCCFRAAERLDVAIGMLVLVIVYLAVLTWQTMGAFRCARRIGGFWPIVAIVVFGVAWLGKIVENFDVSPPLGVVLIIWFSAIAMVSLPMRSLGSRMSAP